MEHPGHASHMEVTPGDSCGKNYETAWSSWETGQHNLGSRYKHPVKSLHRSSQSHQGAASTTWATTSNASLSKLDQVQNVAHCKPCWCHENNTHQGTEKRADLEPLELWRTFKILTQTEKIRRLAGHPFHNKLDAPANNRLKRQSLNHLAIALWRTHADILDPQIGEENLSAVETGTRKISEPPYSCTYLASSLLNNRYQRNGWPWL